MTLWTRHIKNNLLLNKYPILIFNNRKLSTNKNNNDTSTTNSSVQGEIDQFYSKLPKHVVIDVIFENGKTIAPYPYLLTRTINIPSHPINWPKTKLLLIPAKCGQVQGNATGHQDENFIQLLKLVMTHKRLTSQHLLNIVNEKPKKSISSKFAIFALRTIIAHINHERAANELQALLQYPLQSITLNVLIDRLTEIGEPQALLEALELLSMNSEPMTNKWRERILTTIIIDLYNSVFKLNHVFKTIDLVAKYSSELLLFREKLPLLWVGLTLNESSINRQNIIKLFDYFEPLTKSRSSLLLLIERHIEKYWKSFNTRDSLIILHTLRNFQIKNSEKIHRIMSQWFNRNIFHLSPNAFQEVLKCFISCKYNDKNVVKAVERYLKARSDFVDDPHLFVQIAIYLTEFRERNSIILDRISDMLIQNINMFAPYAVKDMLYTFGILYYKPNTEIVFWDAVDQYITQNFSRIPVDDLMYILLSYIYLENYTIKYKPKLFQPEYLNNFRENTTKVRTALEHLYIYDMTLTLFNEKYYGPMLSRGSSNVSALYDKDIAKCILKMEKQFRQLFDKYNMDFHRFVRLPQMPISKMYIVDVLAFEKDLIKQPIYFKEAFQKSPEKFRAVLIAKPNYYTSDKHVIGSENLRANQMRKLGLKTIFINYDFCMKENNNFNNIQNYIEWAIFK